MGVTDEQLVPGENAAFEDFNYARYDGSKWLCYKSILSGEGAEARSTSCVDNNGITGVNCQAPNTGTDEPAALDDPVVQQTMTELIRHHVEHGCKRADTIEFTSPAEEWVRCGAGCEPKHKYTRPPKCNLCEETGLTKEYECARFFDQSAPGKLYDLFRRYNGFVATLI